MVEFPLPGQSKQFPNIAKSNETRDTKNLQFLMTEIYNMKTNLAPPILDHLFQFHESTLIKKFDLNFRNFREPMIRKRQTMD